MKPQTEGRNFTHAKIYILHFLFIFRLKNYLGEYEYKTLRALLGMKLWNTNIWYSTRSQLTHEITGCRRLLYILFMSRMRPDVCDSEADRCSCNLSLSWGWTRSYRLWPFQSDYKTKQKQYDPGFSNKNIFTTVKILWQ